MSSAVQANLNSQATSAINPDYYIDQNRGKQNLFDVDHVILNGGTLTLNRDLLHRRKLALTISAASTVQLPSPELCLGVDFEAIFVTGGAFAITFTSTANASISGGGSAANILATVVAISGAAVVNSSMAVAKTSVIIPVTAGSTVLRFRSVGLYWVIDGICSAATTAVTFT